MTPERWRHINTLLQEALDRSPAEREVFLDEACSDDEASRREVQSLISLQHKATVFLEVPALDAAADLFAGDQAPSLTGQLVGQYKIVSLLGSGGMGEVYLAEDTKLDRRVAIKFLPPDLEADELAHRRQIREAKAAAKLDHPNICAIYEVAEEAGHSFIVMQYVEGDTLASRTELRPMELRESLDVAIQVADALSVAHSHGIIHRDIKPHNIMITPRGQVKVLDFGLAKVVRRDGEEDSLHRLSALSAPGVIVGTVPYMSPEQAKGAPVDARSDLFSLGVVLYECVAGKPAFGGNTPMEICAQVIHVDPAPPSQVNPNVPAELDQVILKALAKEANSRYQSAAELLEELRAVRHALKTGDSVPTKPIAIKLRESRAEALMSLPEIARRPRVLATAVVVALAALSVPFWWHATTHRAVPEAMYWCDKGTTALHEGLYFTASKALERAVQLDDKFALAHARLAEAWAELDYGERAKDELLRLPDRSSLPASEALYVEAIRKTVLRDFVPAIESYHEIARRSPDNERAQVFVDLGRAYEKNDQLEEAKKNYLQASQIAPQDAAAFLRLGVLYTQQQDYAAAAQALDTAQSLYETLNNFEGVIEVHYQRAVLFTDRGRQTDARVQAQKALNMARDFESRHQIIRTLLELSRITSTAGETAQAQTYAADAINLAQASDMETLSTQGLIEIGNAFRVHGDYGEAEKYFEKALEFAQRNKGRRNEARSRVALGALSITCHDADKGLEYITQALQFYEEGGYRREAAMAFYHFGRAYELKGDAEASRNAHNQQLRLAEQVDDQSLVALAHRGIAVAAVYQERYPEALSHFRESCSIYRSLGNQLYAGNRLIDIGDMLWRLGRFEAARTAFDEAVSIAEQPSVHNRQMWDSLSLVQAYTALSERNFSEAVAKAQLAAVLNAKSEHALEAKSLIGLARALSGARREGLRICKEAAESAQQTKYPPILSGALLALAEAMLENGDSQGALTSALEAQGRFEAAAQYESQCRALLIAARASLLSGDAIKAREYAAHAEGLLSTLQQQWGTEAYSDYLTRPDIRHYRSYLSQILRADQ
jgi:serine/threonine protein kinase/tetratricopeptide (TPR) repeat protein